MGEKDDLPPPYSPHAPPMEHVYPNLPHEEQMQQSQPSQPPQPQVTHVTTILSTLGPKKTRIQCPHCKADVTTSTSRHPSTKAYIASFILCLFGCVLGCCCIPCCMDSCKVTEHSCPNCKRFISKYNHG